MDASGPLGAAGFASTGMLLGRWAMTWFRQRKFAKWKRETDEAVERGRIERSLRRAALDQRPRPPLRPRNVPLGAVVDSTGEVNPRIPIWYGAPPHMRRDRLPPG